MYYVPAGPPLWSWPLADKEIFHRDRYVMAVPGNITQKTSYGPNYLLKQGAHPVTGTRNILELLWSRQRASKPPLPGRHL
jgi:predicted Rossmann fold nucleotide-binding protein DprA/Smf involved in DNA uptake